MADILIQAGHEGGIRNGGKPSTGTKGEVERTVPVANRAGKVLESYGISVVREGATFDQKYDVKLALFLHFDGNNRACASGASVGYPDGVPAGSNKPTANAWKALYDEYWPFRFMPDNFTPALKGYYGYAYTNTEIAEVLIEFGELTCPEQKAWLDNNLNLLGDLVAYFAAKTIGVDIPKPMMNTPKPPAGYKPRPEDIHNQTDADRALEYQGTFAPGMKQASYQPGNWIEGNSRVWVVLGRIAAWATQIDERLRRLGG